MINNGGGKEKLSENQKNKTKNKKQSYLQDSWKNHGTCIFWNDLANSASANSASVCYINLHTVHFPMDQRVLDSSEIYICTSSRSCHVNQWSTKIKIILPSL